MTVYDYVIVGAGSAGCALAARLSECGKYSVVLLEAGEADTHPWLHLPIGYGKVFHDPRFNWRYTAAPEPHLNGTRMYWPRGKGLGGSSSINAMVYVRGHRMDFEEWGKVAPGWSWKDVAPVFKRMEAWDGPPDQIRGTDGPLSVRDMHGQMHPLTLRYLQAADACGYPHNPDYNGSKMTGVSTYQITTRKGLRASASAAYLRPAKGRANLRVQTGAHIRDLVFDEGKVTGVRFVQNGREQTVSAGREVVLCAGAIDTPRILLNSGLGPAGDLQPLGIPVRADLPAVGQNLMDHLGLDLTYQARVPSLNQVLRPFAGKVVVALQYLLSRSGPLSMSLNQGGGFIRVAEGEGPPDTQLYFSPLSYTRAPEGKRPLMRPDPFPAFRLGFNPCKPTSKGYLRLCSPDWTEPPEMIGNYLDTEHDRQLMVESVKVMRRIADAPALRDVIDHEMIPGQGIQTDDEILDHIRRDSWSVFHQCGTCAMGSDPVRSVVDARLRVHGVSGLRVADASIFPTIPSGNTNAPSIMVGEKASDLIREDAAT